MSERRLTEQQWRDLDGLRKYWHAFCDADPVPDGFIERMEAAGYARLRNVTRADLREPFASDRGIEIGGGIWELTARGHKSIVGEICRT